MSTIARHGGAGAWVNPVPAERNRVVDLVRVLALCGVVLGHWLKQGWYVDGAGTLHRAGLLGIATWTHPLTWIFQVMPLFFLVGGYANAISWRHAQAQHVSYGDWLAARTRRLTRPLLPLLVFWAIAAPVAPHVGLGGSWLRIGSLTSLVPLWFLATYLGIVTLVPVTMAAWERWGPRSLDVGLLAFPIDALSLHLDSTAIGAVNLVVVWGTLHQLGYAWRDGAFRRPGRAMGLALPGLVGAVLLVRFGPYSVSMVGVGGYGVNNTNPPRATLLLLGCAFAGLTFLAEPRLRRLAERPRVWGAVVVLESRMMTIYLWHLTALVVLGAGSLWMDGAGLRALPNTQNWWLMRPAWILLLAVTTTVIVAAVGGFEDPIRKGPAPTSGAAGPLLLVLVLIPVLGLLADDGLGASARVSPAWVPVIGALSLLASTRVRPTRRSGGTGAEEP